MEKRPMVQKGSSSRKHCTGTVYHDSTVERPQNICPICGEKFLFQLQLRIHLETHEDEEENAEDDLDEMLPETDRKQTVNDNASHNSNSFIQIQKLTNSQWEAFGEATNQDDITDLGVQNVASRLSADVDFTESYTNTSASDCNADINDLSEIESLDQTEHIEPENSKPEGKMLENTEFQDADVAENVSIENDVFISQVTDTETNPVNENDNTMDLDYGVVEEISKTACIETDINLGEVINQIKEGEENKDKQHSSNFSEGTEVIVMNKDVGKLNRKPHISKLKHKCAICNELFQWPYQLKRHVNIHNGFYPYECEICGRKFDRSSSLRDHGMVHRKDRPYECEVCHVKFTLKNNLSKHMNRHTKEKVWQCEHCRKSFLQRDQLIAHLIVHKGEKPFPCEVCGKGFARKTNLKEHMITHSTEKNYPCDFCHKKFSKPYSKKVHMRHHLNTKPHKCDVCGASFSQSCALVTHIRRHTGERPFACPLCPRSFAQQSTLQTHVATHTGEKNFKCGVCTKAFLRKRSLTEHMRMHTGEKPFNCMMCDFSTATKVGLKKHIETHVKQLIRNSDIDLSGLIDLPQLESTTAQNQNDYSDYIEGKEEVDRLSDEADMECFNVENGSHSDNQTLKENPDQGSDLNQREPEAGQISGQRADPEKESLVFNTGFNLIVSEISKHCKNEFDPQLLDEGFVRHIINQSSLLSKNSNKHTKEPTRFECDICGFVLPHKKLMTEHMKTHRPAPDNKKHTCELCGKRFLHRKSLLIHNRTHTGERPYKCELCEADFTNKRSLQKHYHNIHKGIVVVKSAQEYAEALAEKKEIEDIDSQAIAESAKAEKKKTAKKTDKVKANAASVKKKTEKTNDNIPVDDVEASNSGNHDTLVGSELVINKFNPTEDILKQAELAAKSICESLFSKKNNNRTKAVEKDSKKKKSAKTIDAGVKYLNGQDGFLETKKKPLKLDENKKIRDGFSLLRKALQSVKPEDLSNEREENTETQLGVDDTNCLIQDIPSVISNHTQESYNTLIQLDGCAPELDGSGQVDMKNVQIYNVEENSMTHSFGQKQADSEDISMPAVGKTIQNEYEMLRKSLQKSLNRVMIAPLFDD